MRANRTMGYWVSTALGGLALMVGGLAAATSCSQEYLTGIEWPEPEVVTPGDRRGQPPSDAIILFDGSSLDAWKDADTWTIDDGTMVVGRNMVETKEHFGDCQLHIEWSCPTPAKGDGQGRGNSGVFFGPYELQVLDSYENETYFDGQAGAIYKQMPPMVNAMRPPGEWNVYDIVWTAPRFNDDGTLASPAFITAFHNGVVIQNHFQILGDTPFNRPPQYNQHTVEQPIRLQDHGNPVRFRNIWVRKIAPIVGKQVGDPSLRVGDREIPLSDTGKVSGTLTLDGARVDSAVVTLHADDGNAAVDAAVRDGKFQFAEVVPGKYAVTIVDGDRPGEGPAIPERYRARDAAPIMVEIVPGQNEFNIDLTSI